MPGGSVEDLPSHARTILRVDENTFVIANINRFARILEIYAQFIYDDETHGWYFYTHLNLVIAFI